MASGKRLAGDSSSSAPTTLDALPKRPKLEQSPGPDLQAAEFASSYSRNGIGHLIHTESNVAKADDEPHNAVSTPTWDLRPSEIPVQAKKIYCVMKGHKRGFFFEYFGAGGAEEQVRGYQGNLFMSFPKGKKASLKPNNVNEVILDAVRYMNHDSDSCSYGCGDKCRPDNIQRHHPQPSRPAKNEKEFVNPMIARSRARNLCRACGKVPPSRGGRMCESCMSSPDVSSRIQASNEKFALSEEQSRVLDLVAQGRNVFFTGAAGTGKSRVLQALVDFLKSSGLQSTVVAPTGMVGWP